MSNTPLYDFSGLPGVPVWATSDDIWVLYGIHLLAYKRLTDTNYYNVTNGCEFCGECCRNLDPQTHPHPLVDGDCMYLVPDSRFGQGKYVCQLGYGIPLSCSKRPLDGDQPAGCSMTFTQRTNFQDIVIPSVSYDYPHEFNIKVLSGYTFVAGRMLDPIDSPDGLQWYIKDQNGQCGRCGECCKNLSESADFQYIVDGNCGYLVKEKGKWVCSIPEDRPVACLYDPPPYSRSKYGCDITHGYVAIQE